GSRKSSASRTTSAAAVGQRLRTSTRPTTAALASAMASTDAMASDADDHVDPHSSANWTIDFVSSSMKLAPSRKKCQKVRSHIARLKPPLDCARGGPEPVAPRRGSGRPCGSRRVEGPETTPVDFGPKADTAPSETTDTLRTTASAAR